MQLVCRYGIDPKNADFGIALVDYSDAAVVDMTPYAGCVLVPGQPALDTLPRLGPEPDLLGDAPTGTYPSAAELKAAGLDKDHPAWQTAGQPYPDNRRAAVDFRPRRLRSSLTLRF